MQLLMNFLISSPQAVVCNSIHSTSQQGPAVLHWLWVPTWAGVLIGQHSAGADTPPLFRKMHRNCLSRLGTGEGDVFFWVAVPSPLHIAIPFMSSTHTAYYWSLAAREQPHCAPPAGPHAQAGPRCHGLLSAHFHLRIVSRLISDRPWRDHWQGDHPWAEPLLYPNPSNEELIKINTLL